MDGRTIARIGAVAFAAVAIAATAIEMNRSDELQVSVPARIRLRLERDPLDTELVRCRGIGEAALRDPLCLRAWSNARRRFLGQPASAAPAAPTPATTPATLFPSAPSAVPAPPDSQPGSAQPSIPSAAGTH